MIHKHIHKASYSTEEWSGDIIKWMFRRGFKLRQSFCDQGYRYRDNHHNSHVQLIVLKTKSPYKDNLLTARESFYDSWRKGLGLRTLENLPKGAFICEYVGEIVTNSELYDRNKQCAGEKHIYPVLLDADWGSEGVLKDEEALCLDATSYGNIARFINHRCGDANMVEVPVEIETPDHHYYHVAFFTAREVTADEELTWDYGIDFGDTNHPIKAFKCCCGSKLCR
ncbi:hypothetical protein AgCh_034443 [Apium graveolens]